MGKSEVAQQLDLVASFLRCDFADIDRGAAEGRLPATVLALHAIYSTHLPKPIMLLPVLLVVLMFFALTFVPNVARLVPRLAPGLVPGLAGNATNITVSAPWGDTALATTILVFHHPSFTYFPLLISAYALSSTYVPLSAPSLAFPAPHFGPHDAETSAL